MTLHTAEVFALRRALDDIDFKHAFTAFAQHIAEEARTFCCTAMLYPPKIEQAIGYAAQAQSADELVNKLEAFIQDQLARH